MKGVKLCIKSRQTPFKFLTFPPRTFFGQTLNLHSQPQKSYDLIPSLSHEAFPEAEQESAEEVKIQKPEASQFVSRTMFQRIRLDHANPLISLSSVSEAIALTDPKDLDVFAYIAERLDLEKHLSPGFVKAYGFPIDRLNLLAMYFGVKFVLSEVLVPKKPVISIMGHVDHGKTTLLDFYRNSRKAEGEVGGITQKIGGFSLETKFGPVSFIDTPGHAVFANMRRTGAFLADIVVLIVSATDGVQPQTVEVLELIKEHRLPFVVAINKIDVQGADPEAVEEQLVELGVDLEPYGGHVSVLHISAKTGQNLDLLLELLVEEARSLALQSDTSALPECLVLEAALSSGDNIKRSSVVVKNGTLQVGQPMVVGDCHFRISRLSNDLGQTLAVARPGDIVEIAGPTVFPKSTERVLGMPSDGFARLFLEVTSGVKKRFFKEADDVVYSEYKIKFADRWEKHRFYGDPLFFKEKLKTRSEELRSDLGSAAADDQKSSDVKRQLADLNFMLNELEGKDLFNPIFIKVGNMGALETVKNHLSKIENSGFTLMEISCGQITEQDLKRCKQAKAKIITFDLPKCPEVTRLLKQYEIKCVSHEIIYKLFDDLKLLGQTAKPQPAKVSTVTGRASVKKIFSGKSEKGLRIKIAGCCVDSGTLRVSNKFRILRNGKLIADNLSLSSLKRFKQEVQEVAKGQETGLSFANHNDLDDGDLIEAYE